MSTTLVMRHLVLAGINVYRINDSDELSVVSLDPLLPGESLLHVGRQVISLARVKSYWYRRGDFQWADHNIMIAPLHTSHLQTLRKTMLQEREVWLQFLGNYLSTLPALTRFGARHINKPEVLARAEDVGILTPQTLITGDKRALKQFVQAHGQVITKPLHSMPFFDANDGSMLAFYTKEVDAEVVERLPDKFSPSLFQKYISKKYEIRVFYLRGQCYAMAILSQGKESTTLDFRMIQKEGRARSVPYTLPPVIEEKIRSLMDSLVLQTGSLDFILSTSGEYCFLEVNPTGQLGMTSVPCNYHLESRIANALMQDIEQSKDKVHETLH